MNNRIQCKVCIIVIYISIFNPDRTRWLELHSTCHHKALELVKFAKRFGEGEPRYISENWMSLEVKSDENRKY